MLERLLATARTLRCIFFYYYIFLASEQRNYQWPFMGNQVANLITTFTELGSVAAAYRYTV